MSEIGGTFNPELLGRLLDELWRPIQVPARRITFWMFPLKSILDDPELDRVASAFADYAEAYAARKASCSAVLFPVASGLPLPVEPVHPLDVAYFNPVQGPCPAVCAREPHPDSPLHWDGRGTWWR